MEAETQTGEKICMGVKGQSHNLSSDIRIVRRIGFYSYLRASMGLRRAGKNPKIKPMPIDTETARTTLAHLEVFVNNEMAGYVRRA